MNETSHEVGREPMENGRKQTIYGDIRSLLLELSGDWDVGEISLETALGSVIQESIGVVYFIGDLQQRYRLGDRLFQEVRAGAVRIPELKVKEVVDFIYNMTVEGGKE